jgi:co-chaperonin GroES (HSP10)
VSSLPQRLLQNMQGTFIPARWTGVNTSGYTPIGRNILVRMDMMANMTAGGVILPDAKIDAMNEASETACIYALGPGAFKSYRDGRAWTGEALRVGDRIYIEKYAGIQCRGRDDMVYRLIECDMIGARMDFGYADDEQFADLQGDAA